ncbi:MAG: ribosome maturation factor RimP [Bacillota bacterium]|nr:ribosome maturation factor RimP [Bacillota bacterium]
MGKIEEAVEALARKVAEKQSCAVYDVEYKKEGHDWYLRIYVDKEGGIGIDDCERFSREISPMLDAEDPIKDNYILEVSSPGMFRKLTKPEHFANYIGEEVEVKLYKSENGRKVINGVLTAYDGSTVTVQCEGESISVDKEKYMYVKLNPQCF